MYIRIRPNWKYISTAQNGQELAHGVVLPKLSVQYTSVYVLIENTLVQHKMAKNLHMVLCYQNRVSKGTNQHYGLHSLANIAAHSASDTVLGLLKKKTKKKELVQNGVLAVSGYLPKSL